MTHISKMIAAMDYDPGVVAKQIGVAEEEIDSLASQGKAMPESAKEGLMRLLGISELYLTKGTPEPKHKGDKAMIEKIATYEEKSDRLLGKKKLEEALSSAGKEETQAILDCFYDGWKPYPYSFNDVSALALLKLDDFSLFELLSSHFAYRKERNAPENKEAALEMIATDGKVIYKDLEFYRHSGIKNIATADEFLAKTKGAELDFDDALILEAIAVGGRIKQPGTLLSGPSYDVFETMLLEDYCKNRLAKKKGK